MGIPSVEYLIGVYPRVTIAYSSDGLTWIDSGIDAVGEVPFAWVGTDLFAVATATATATATNTTLWIGTPLDE